MLFLIALLSSCHPLVVDYSLWGLATLLSNYEGELSDTVEANALIIQRKVAEQIAARAFTFKSQELSNSSKFLLVVYSIDGISGKLKPLSDH